MKHADQKYDPLTDLAAGWSELLSLAGAFLFFSFAVVHVLRIGDPMPMADNWTNIDVFLRKAYYEGVGVSDFLWKRLALSQDHAQPLNKALLWINARYFGLDFMLEGLFALLFGLGAFLMLRRASTSKGTPVPWQTYLCTVAIAGVFFSSNSSVIYNWSMVTLWFSLYLAMFCTVWAAWSVFRGGNISLLLIASFAFGVVADDVGYLGCASIAIALLLCGLKTDRRQTLLSLLGLGIGLGLSRLFYSVFQDEVALTSSGWGPGDFFHFLANSTGEFWDWYAIPAASGLAYQNTLNFLLGADVTPFAINALAAVMLPCHVWFWWKAITRRPKDLAGFMAVCVMLFAYAHVAGIIYSRVPVFGTEYLHSGRYVSFYQLAVVALLLMLVSCINERKTIGARTPWPMILPAILVILWQFPLTWSAYVQSQYVESYIKKEAKLLTQVARDPINPPANCQAVIAACRFPAEQRQRVMDLLIDNRLSIFSPQFRSRHPSIATVVVAEEDEKGQ